MALDIDSMIINGRPINRSTARVTSVVYRAVKDAQHAGAYTDTLSPREHSLYGTDVQIVEQEIAIARRIITQFVVLPEGLYGTDEEYARYSNAFIDSEHGVLSVANRLRASNMFTAVNIAARAAARAAHGVDQTVLDMLLCDIAGGV